MGLFFSIIEQLLPPVAKAATPIPLLAQLPGGRAAFSLAINSASVATPAPGPRWHGFLISDLDQLLLNEHH